MPISYLFSILYIALLTARANIKRYDTEKGNIMTPESRYSSSLKTDLEQMEIRFNCDNEQELNFVTMTYQNPEAVKKFIKTHCTHWLKHKPSFSEVYETLNQQGFEKDL